MWLLKHTLVKSLFAYMQSMYFLAAPAELLPFHSSKPIPGTCENVQLINITHIM